MAKAVKEVAWRLVLPEIRKIVREELVSTTKRVEDLRDSVGDLRESMADFRLGSSFPTRCY